MKKSDPNIRFAVLAADTVLLTLNDGKLLVRLVEVNRPPYFVNKAGLPGGLLLPREEAMDSAKRHLKIKGGIELRNIYIEQLSTFSEINRDPRGRVVAVAYLALVPWEKLSIKEKENDKNVWWKDVRDVSNLAYDHNQILATALARLKAKVGYTTIIKKLLPSRFTLTELEKAYELICEKNLDKRNFRKKITNLRLITPLNIKTSGTKWRPAMLYKFASSEVQEIEIL